MSEISSDKEQIILARKLLNTYGGEVDDFFKLWPDDKIYFFSSDKQAFLAYALKYGVAVCLGDPVGPKKSVSFLLEEFNNYCQVKHITIGFIQGNHKFKDIYKSNGYKKLIFGADALIDTQKFTTTTIKNKYFRNIVNRYEKNQFKFDYHRFPHSKELLKELRLVSDSWLKLPHRKEWSFLTGRFDEDYLQQVNIYALRDKNGKLEAFANELPAFNPEVSSIDLMRHNADSPANSIDYLFIRIIQMVNKEGRKIFNIGVSPLDGKPYAEKLSEKVVLFVYKLSDNFIGYKGLHQFKAKFEPTWDPRYIWFNGRSIGLIRVAIAVYKLLNRS